MTPEFERLHAHYVKAMEERARAYAGAWGTSSAWEPEPKKPSKQKRIFAMVDAIKTHVLHDAELSDDQLRLLILRAEAVVDDYEKYCNG